MLRLLETTVLTTMRVIVAIYSTFNLVVIYTNKNSVKKRISTLYNKKFGVVLPLHRDRATEET